MSGFLDEYPIINVDCSDSEAWTYKLNFEDYYLLVHIVLHICH